MTSEAILEPHTNFTMSFAAGVRYQARRWVDLRATLGVSGQTAVDYHLPSGSAWDCSGRGRGGLLDLAGTAQFRPSQRIPLYFGLGVDVALGITGRGEGPTCRFPVQAIPYVGGRFEYGFHLGPSDSLDLGLRVRVLPSVGQVRDNAVYSLEIYTGVAFGVVGPRPMYASPTRAATAAAIWIPTTLGPLAVLAAVVIVLGAASH